MDVCIDVKNRKDFFVKWWVHLILCIVTLGIWQWVWLFRIIEFLNLAPNMKKRSAGKELLLCMFVPFYSLYSFYQSGKRADSILASNGHQSSSISVVALLLSLFITPTVALCFIQCKLNTIKEKDSLLGLKHLNQIVKYDKWKGWVYLAPCIALLLVFTGWPIVNTLAMAFQNGYDTMEWLNGTNFQIGIANFQKVISYSGFKDCLMNTILLCVITVPVSTFLALLIAVCLNSIKFLSRFLQTIYFLPYVTNSIAIGMVFAAMFNMVGTAFGGQNEIIQSAGIINNILGIFGVEPINWINEGSGYWANIFVMSFYIIWNALPFKILILLGGLQSVNKQYYDAAKIDSTPKWRVFTKITVPLLSPMIAYVVITGFIGGFKEYSSIVGIFGDDMGPTGDPRRLNTMVGYIYNFIDSRQGQASAAALILFGIIFLVTMVNLYVSKKKTHF